MLAHPFAAVYLGLAPASLPRSLRPLLEQRQRLNARLDDRALRGKVVLVNFWTYSCINSLRPLPYLKAWPRNTDRAAWWW